MVKIKKFDKVRINNKHDIHHNKVGVVVAITRKLKNQYPYHVAFSIDKDWNVNTGIYREFELTSLE